MSANRKLCTAAVGACFRLRGRRLSPCSFLDSHQRTNPLFSPLYFHSTVRPGVSGSRLADYRVPVRSISVSGSSSGGMTWICWNCGAQEAFLACASCRSVQPVDHAVDYFQIYDLAREYEIKDDNLEGKYKHWQKKLHPDLVHTKSEKERNYAAEQSARVIDAYSTLRNPLSRALYLLQLEGVHVDEEKTVMDPELLSEMMEIREYVEEAKCTQELMDMQSQIKTKFQEWSRSFSEAFRRRDFAAAIAATHRMRYYKKAAEEVTKKL